MSGRGGPEAATHRGAAAHRVAGQADPPPRVDADGGRPARPRRRRARDERLLPARRGRGGHAGRRDRRLVHRADARARRAPRTCCARRSPGGPTRGCTCCDPAFAGSDTLATARALAAAAADDRPLRPRAARAQLARRRDRPGRPRAGRSCSTSRSPAVCAGWRTSVTASASSSSTTTARQDVEVTLPAVLSVAERLCDPCKVDPGGPGGRARRRASRGSARPTSAPGPWGEAGSPTVVGEVHPMEHDRACLVLDGPIAEQVEEAVRLLDAHAARSATGPAAHASAGRRPALRDSGAGCTSHRRARRARARRGGASSWWRRRRASARDAGALVHLLRPVGAGEPGPMARSVCPAGADLVVELTGSRVPEDVADAVTAYVRDRVAVGRSWPRARRSGARWPPASPRPRGPGLVGDAVSLAVRDGVLVAGKPAFAGALVADITCRRRRRRWSRCGRASCPPPRPRRGAARYRGVRDARRRHGAGACASWPSGATTTSRRWPGPQVVIGVGHRRGARRVRAAQPAGRCSRAPSWRRRAR